MSAKNESSDILKSFQAFNMNQIDPELRVKYENIIHQIQHRMFFDRDLNYRQQMFLLYQPNGVENEFILYLYDRLHNMHISEDLRDSLSMNLNRISEDFTHINAYSGTNQQPIPYNDPDEDYDAQTTTPTHLGDHDTTVDLENQLLQDIEFGRNLPPFFFTTHETDDQSIGERIPKH